MSEVKDIPEGWVETTLGEVVTFQRGFDLPTKDRTNGSYPLMVSNGQDGTHKDFKVIGPGIITGRSGSLGNVFFVKENFWPLNTTLWIKNFHNNDVKFVYYFLKTFPFEKFNSGSGVPTLNRNHIHPLPVIIPESKTEQKSIAAILTAFDNKIELLQSQNKTLEETAQTIFKEWFCKYQIDDKLPEGWRVGKLGDEFDILMGQSPRGESYNIDGNGTLFFQGRAEFTDRFPVKRLYTTEPKRIANKFDVLVSVRAPVGDVNVANERCCIGRGLSAVQGNFKSYALYKIKFLKPQFDLFESEGTVFGSINKDSFNNIEVVIPPNQLLSSFEDIAQLIDRKIFENHSQIQTLTQTRDALLPKLMNGEIRVNDFKNQ